jgi:hypothetical protein
MSSALRAKKGEMEVSSSLVAELKSKLEIE